MTTILKSIPLKEIHENPVALRAVDRTTEQYLGLVDSIRRNGILNAIVVREVQDRESGQTVYGLIDGLHRFTAAQDAGLTEIPAQVKSMDDAEVLEAQIIANVQKVETKPVQYSKQLIRILIQNPTMTMTELASRLSKSPKWLDDRLGLTKLHDDIASLVDENKINLSNAYVLAKLPADEQANFLDRAMTMSPQEFVPTVNTRIKEIRDAKRQGRDPSSNTFTPVPHARKLGELKEEMDAGNYAAAICKEFNITSPVEAFKMAVRWVLHMDPASVEAARQKDEARKKEEKEAKERRKKERENLAAAEAAQKAAQLKEQLEKVS